MTQVDETTQQEQENYTTALALIPRGAASITPIHGVEINVDASFEAKRAALAAVDEMIGDGEHIDAYLNTCVWAMAVAQHDAEVRGKDGILRPETRTVLHLVASDGKEHSAKRISFTSKAVANYFRQRVIPMFGMQFDEPLPFIFKRITTASGNSYSVKSPLNKRYPEA